MYDWRHESSSKLARGESSRHSQVRSRGKPHLAVACDHPGQPGLASLLNALGKLAVAGVPVRLGRLTAGRSARLLDTQRFEVESSERVTSTSLWMVNGARARLASGPEPVLFGQGPALPSTLAQQVPGKLALPAPLVPPVPQNGDGQRDLPPGFSCCPRPRSCSFGITRVRSRSRSVSEQHATISGSSTGDDARIPRCPGSIACSGRCS